MRQREAAAATAAADAAQRKLATLQSAFERVAAAARAARADAKAAEARADKARAAAVEAVHSNGASNSTTMTAAAAAAGRRQRAAVQVQVSCSEGCCSDNFVYAPMNSSHALLCSADECAVALTICVVRIPVTGTRGDVTAAAAATAAAASMEQL